MVSVMTIKHQKKHCVAVTGHRFIPSDVRLRDSVHRVLAKILEGQMPHPVVLLSALAEGADQLVAEMAMDFSEIELHVPLPKPEERYLDDFTNDSGKQAYRELRLRAREMIPLSHSDDEGNAYQALGEYLINHAGVLIALWNGVFNQQKGGTGDVVQTALDAEVPVYWIYCPNQKPGEINTLGYEKQIGEIEAL